MIDRTNPPFSKIQLINGTDRGVDTNDRYTAEKKPIVNFTAEPGLRIYLTILMEPPQPQFLQANT